MKIMHICPQCKKMWKCSIYESNDVENYVHVCDICGYEWEHYHPHEIKQIRELEEKGLSVVI